MKTNKVDKINPFHIKMLLGQIIKIEETGYVRIVTEYGKVNTLITPSQLYPCTASNMKLDFSTKTSFTAARKKASGLYMFGGSVTSQCKILIVPEEGWFGQLKYSTPTKNQSTLCRFLLLFSSFYT